MEILESERATLSPLGNYGTKAAKVKALSVEHACQQAPDAAASPRPQGVLNQKAARLAATIIGGR
jgi:hypothetical protein